MGSRARKASEGGSPDSEGGGSGGGGGGGPPTFSFRNRASTDGHLHQRRLYKLRMTLNLRSSNLHERRMSIAMRGATCGF
ncbi:hypothetical protein Pmani_029550 [Petrolisthes manimaculis]|uniref:Uncharacterized protein n=1 Tax=Petrolisthes manimaculis TaxID=1843537 RepID=A0AAE1NZB8_9EUCA|nr:hypothetical protein Pmani_029550 [Petrolisthes manimaculis]